MERGEHPSGAALTGTSGKAPMLSPRHHAAFNNAMKAALAEASRSGKSGDFAVRFEVTVSANPGSVGEYRIKLDPLGER